MLEDRCIENKLMSMHQDITKIIEISALIAPSVAEVERSFSLMNLTSTPLCQRLSVENLGRCMTICKFPRNLTENDYQQILSQWLGGAEPNQKAAESIIVYRTKKNNFYYLYIILFDMLEEKKTKILY